jgi:glutamate synthase (NADPH/NADH) small chain
MQKFHLSPQSYPNQRNPELRRHDFAEIYEAYSNAKAADQAERCLQCGVPFCSVHCPLHNNIPDWLRAVAEGNLHDAYLLSSATNNFPEICGRVCPQDKLCEGNCVVERGFGSITIGSVEKYITDNAWNEGWVQPFAPSHERPQSVGIIGSGPAGMAAAQQLRQAGFQVHIYDRYDRAGGMMIYGIPNFKLEKDIVLRRHQQYEQSGVVFHFGVQVGENCTLKELQNRHDAILIATGVYQARNLEIAGDNLKNVHHALPYLTNSTREILGDNIDGAVNANAKDVVVIGGGDTAMDCVRTAIRQGANSVRCLYRRTQENMPGSAREVKNAIDEGVQFEWLTSPIQLLGNSQVEAIEVQQMQLSPSTASGRRDVEPIQGSNRIISTNMVITALGFEAEDLPIMFGAPELKVRKGGTIRINHHNMMSSVDGVFAAGDIVRGSSLVVWAIADGRNAATHIQNYILNQTKP